MTRRSHSDPCSQDRRAVVLCAGASSRMGRPKGLLPLDGRALLRAHVDAFRDADLPVTVVLGALALEHVEVLPGAVQIVFNESWCTTGMSDSAFLGLRGAGVAVVTPVDVPPVRPDTLRALFAVEGPAVPTWRGAPGHPVKLVPPHVHMRLDERLRDARHVPVDDPDCVRNLNHPEEWEAWLAEREARRRGLGSPSR